MSDSFKITPEEKKAGEKGLVKARQALAIAQAQLKYNDPFKEESK